MIIFILFVAYIAFQIMALRPAYLREVRNEILRSESYQLSDLLVNDPGEPLNWDVASVKRIGLSNENVNKTNYLSVAKIVKLVSLCPQAGYSTSFPQKFGIDQKYQFSIIVKNITSGLPLADCHPSSIIAARAINTSIKRVVVLDSGEYGEVTVQMW
jgi:hypothetical protein